MAVSSPWKIKWCPRDDTPTLEHRQVVLQIYPTVLQCVQCGTVEIPISQEIFPKQAIPGWIEELTPEEDAV